MKKAMAMAAMAAIGANAGNIAQCIFAADHMYEMHKKVVLYAKHDMDADFTVALPVLRRLAVDVKVYCVDFNKEETKKSGSSHGPQSTLDFADKILKIGEK